MVGTYFKPARATRLMAQAQETQKAISANSRLSPNQPSSKTGLGGGPLSSSFNSGLNTFGLNNSYSLSHGGGGGGGKLGGSASFNGQNSSTNSSTTNSPQIGSLGSNLPRKDVPVWLGNGLNTSNANSDLVRKPTRLEALPNVGDVNRKSSTRKKSSGPILNTMGTF